VTQPPAALLCGAATVFTVQDVLRSVEHYRDVLGFHTEFTWLHAVRTVASVGVFVTFVGLCLRESFFTE
jgi:hypothetical protein